MERAARHEDITIREGLTTFTVLAEGPFALHRRTFAANERQLVENGLEENTEVNVTICNSLHTLLYTH